MLIVNVSVDFHQVRVRVMNNSLEYVFYDIPCRGVLVPDMLWGRPVIRVRVMNNSLEYVFDDISSLSRKRD